MKTGYNVFKSVTIYNNFLILRSMIDYRLNKW